MLKGVIEQLKLWKSALVQFVNCNIYPLHTQYVKGHVPKGLHPLEVAFDYQMSPPITLEQELHPVFQQKKKVHYPELFIADLAQAYVWGNQGAVITGDKKLFDAVSREFDRSGKEHSIFKQTQLIPAEQRKEKIAVVATSGANVYYHWMLDVVPRILLLKQNGYLNESISLVLNDEGLPFQSEILEKLGIRAEQLIRPKDHWNFHVAAPLLVPSLISPNDCPSPWAISAVQQLFPIEAEEHSPKKKLYLQRKKGRSIMNEVEVLDLLKNYAFEIVHPEDLSVQEQAKLFAQASFIIGPHGAGFTNLLFCKEGTKIIDIFSPEWVNPCYWILSSIKKLNYGYMIGEGPPVSTSKQGKGAHITLDIDKLNLFIQKMLK